jgi:hypothetical protein
MSKTFDIFKELPHRMNGDMDNEFSFRAMLTVDADVPAGRVRLTKMFPPAQLRTVENKADFHRLLNSHLDQLKAEGTTVHSVSVRVGGKDAFSFSL